MLDLPVSDNDPEQFGLHQQERQVRGLLSRTIETGASIELTPPRVTPITQELTAGDPELAAFWLAEQGKFRYHYVTFRATFIPDATGFEAARLAVQLGPNQPPDAVVAWSMSPELLADPTKAKDTGKLGFDFKLVKAELGEEVETAGQTWFLRRRNEQTATPFWELQPTDASSIEGQFRFHLVTRAAYDLPAFGTLSARATIERRSFLIFRRSDPAAAPADVRFELPLASTRPG